MIRLPTQAHPRMNYRKLTRRLRQLGCQFVRQAPGSHEIWWNPANKPFTVTGIVTCPKAHGERSCANQASILLCSTGGGRVTDLTMHHLAIPLGLTGTYPRAGLRSSRTAPDVILVLILTSTPRDMNEAITSHPGIAERQQSIYTSLRVAEASPVASEE